MTVLVIDNYDSFTYNLVQYLGELGAEVEVLRNDMVSVDEVAERGPASILISPGPCTPAEAGISVSVVRELGARIPILGVCLGHQAVAVAYGGRVIHAPGVMHGKTSEVHHRGEGLFAGLPSPFGATRYHSLVADPAAIPEQLEVTAWSAAGEDPQGIVMGLQHREHPVHGVQFHPESILTEQGKALLRNFLSL